MLSLPRAKTDLPALSFHLRSDSAAGDADILVPAPLPCRLFDPGLEKTVSPDARERRIDCLDYLSLLLPMKVAWVCGCCCTLSKPIAILRARAISIGCFGCIGADVRFERMIQSAFRRVERYGHWGPGSRQLCSRRPDKTTYIEPERCKRDEV